MPMILLHKTMCECSRAFLGLCSEDKDVFWVVSLLRTKFGIINMNLNPKTSRSFIKKPAQHPRSLRSQSAIKLIATSFWNLQGVLLIDYNDKNFSIIMMRCY